MISDTLYRTKIYDNETIIATFKMRITRFIVVLLINLTIAISILALLIYNIKSTTTGEEIYLYAIMGIIVCTINLFFILHTTFRVLNTRYILTDQRIIIKEFMMFHYYGHSFRYNLVDDIEVRKNSLLGTYNIFITLDCDAQPAFLDNAMMDSTPQLIGLSKNDYEFFVTALNKYYTKSQRPKK